MNKAIVSLIFVFVLACHAWAEGGVVPNGFTSGTSLERQARGAFNPDLDDQGETAGEKYWLAPTDTNGMTVVAYRYDEAYDYAAHGTARSRYLDDNEPMNAQYLDLGTYGSLSRCVVPRIETPTGSFAASNVLVKADGHDGIYADTLVKFSPSLAVPIMKGDDKLVVWLRESEQANGAAVTNLVVTAGHYADGFDVVETVHYAVTNVVTAGVWYRLTVRAISNITTDGMRTMPGFVICLDGKPVVMDASCSVGTGYPEDRLTAETRMLLAERRLFPWIASRGSDRKMTLSDLAFSGKGGADDVLVTTESPSFIVPENVFTLRWDAGVVGSDMLCIVSNATGTVTNHIDAAVLPRRRDFNLGTNKLARITMSGVAYDTAHEYFAGVWTAENGCAATQDGFVCDGTGVNPVGFVSSARNAVGIGGAGGFETFAEAKEQAKRQGTRTLCLESDVVVSYGKPTADSKYGDKGRLEIVPGDDFVLDLNGHTLQGRWPNEETIYLKDGRLCIRDSRGGGAVVPPTNCQMSVQSYRYQPSAMPALVIEGGRYDGAVQITGASGEKFNLGKEPLVGTCAIGGGSFTNVTGEVESFYLEQYVTNTTAYFGLDERNYWSIIAENAYVWNGAGADDFWTNAVNWQCRAVPGAGDLAIFPRRADSASAWTVDFGAGTETKLMWMDADVKMSGTNEFSDVRVAKGDGRLVGSGTVVYTGALPGELTASGRIGQEIRLGSAWQGTVRIAGIASAKVLDDIDYWGNDHSQVEFAGVRGYVSDKSNHALPYGLVLTDAADGTVAWKNDTGYTGSTVSFPKLSGVGTFESPKNLREVLQLYQFKDVSEFTGRFRIAGKRLLLGKGYAASKVAGHMTFADLSLVRSGLGWSGVNAHFGDSLFVRGETNDVLMTYTDSTPPSVAGVKVMLLGPDGTTNECSLVVSGMNIVVTNTLGKLRRMMTVGDADVMAEDAAGVIRAGELVSIPPGSAVSVDKVNNRIAVNGRVVTTVASYYELQPAEDAESAYYVSFKEEDVVPTVADFAVDSAGGRPVLVISNAKPGLWYGVQTLKSLAQQDWEGPAAWTRASSGELELSPASEGDNCFFRVIMTDKNPIGGAK